MLNNVYLSCSGCWRRGGSVGTMLPKQFPGDWTLNNYLDLFQSLMKSMANIYFHCLTFLEYFWFSPWQFLWGGAKDQLGGWRERWVLQQSLSGALRFGHLKLHGMGRLHLHSIGKIASNSYCPPGLHPKRLNSTSNRWNESTTEESHCFSTKTEEQEVWGYKVSSGLWTVSYTHLTLPTTPYV